MAQVVHYICDKCSRVSINEDNLLPCTIEIGSNNYYSGRKNRLYLNICSSCAEKLGFIKKVTKENKVVNEIQDTKDKLYETVVQLIQETGIQVQY